MKQKIWNGPAPTLGLAMTASCLFMWGRNWHMYTWPELGLSLALVLGAGSGLGLLVGWLARVLRREGRPHCAVGFRIDGREAWIDAVGFRIGGREALMETARPGRFLTLLLSLLVVWLLLEVLKLFLVIPINSMADQSGILPRYLKIPLALTVFLALYAARGFRLVNTCLLVWLCLSLVGGFLNIHSAPAEIKIAEAGFSVDLKKKPNIYLYFLESYHSPYAMRLLYDHDLGPMVDYLRGKNFLVYDRTLSNSHYTLASMIDTFTMRLNQNIVRGNLDTAPQLRKLLGGSNENNLFKMLKDNGYHITFITMGSQYFFNVQGPNLDSTDAFLSYRPFTPLIDLNPGKFKLLAAISSKWLNEGSFQGTQAERVRQAVERGQQRGGPFMVIFKGGAAHSNGGEGRASREEFDAWKPKYLEYVASGDAEMKEILEYLDVADPEALVILIGDHGAWGYAYFPFEKALKNGDLAMFRRELTERGLTLDKVVQNFFGTFLALRLPGGEHRDIAQGLPMNHVNLFRQIFAYLNNGPNILSTREPALSLLGIRYSKETLLSLRDKFILGRDNQPVLERYEGSE